MIGVEETRSMDFAVCMRPLGGGPIASGMSYKRSGNKTQSISIWLGMQGQQEVLAIALL